MMSIPNNKPKIAVIGGGAAGLLAAGSATKQGGEVTVYEHNPKVGRKLMITGKGRCNVTNNCDVNEVIANVLSNSRFLYAAVSAFSPADVMALIESNGTALKTERGRRVFPVSDHAGDILAALLRYCNGVNFIRKHVTALSLSEGAVKGIVTDKTSETYDAVILATGGLSYPLTGSDGSGYELAKSAGHTVLPLSASLVPLESPDKACAQMQGLSLRNVGLKVLAPDGSVLTQDFGEMLFTHFGVSGPMVLSASALLREDDISLYSLSVDLKPALSEQELNRRLISDFSLYSNRDFANSLCDLLPQKMIPVMVERSGIAPNRKVNSITRQERKKLLSLMKNFTVSLSKRRPISEAIITRGGVCVNEVNPKTMQSRLCNGLYLCGEILDIDAYTGGYNLQIAFSTGYSAGIHSVIRK